LRPHKEFAQVEKISKDPGNTTKFISRKAKKHVTQLNRRSQRGSQKEQRLNPRNSTLSKRAIEKKMLRAFKMETTEASLGDVITKGTKPLSCIQDTMCDLPIKINHWPIKRHEKKRLPSR